MSSYLGDLVYYGKSRFGKDVFQRQYYTPNPSKETYPGPDLYHRKYYVPPEKSDDYYVRPTIKPYSDATRQRVADMQTNFDETTYKQYMAIDGDFLACEFVHYYDAVVNYVRYPSRENAAAVAGHSYRRGNYKTAADAEKFIAYNTDTLFLRQGHIC